MKTLAMILLIVLLSVPSFASSTCVDYRVKAGEIYKEGGSLSDVGESYYNQYLDALDGESPQGARSALRLLNLAIGKVEAAQEKYLQSNNYIKKAQNACVGTELLIANAYGANIRSAIKQTNKELSAIEIDDKSLISTDYYVLEKHRRLDTFIGEKKTNAAIYWIENGNVDLNYHPKFRDKYLDPLLITAAKEGAVDIVKSLVAHGADIEITQDDYTALEIAGIRGDYAMFSYLFSKKASPFLLKGFKHGSTNNQCNFADLVNLAAGREKIKIKNSELTMGDEHRQILAFLKKQGLSPVCSRVVATVNGKEIKQSDVDLLFTLNVLAKFQAKNPGQEIPAQVKDKATKGIIDHLINQEVLVQAATQAQITADMDRVYQNLEELRRSLHGKLSHEQYKQASISLARDDIAMQLVYQEVTSKIQIPEQKLRQFYDSNQDKFTQPEQVRVLNILTKTRKEAEHVLALAKKEGSNFSELARKYSTAPSAKSGGEQGFFKRGVMFKPYEDAAFSLKKGQISPIIKTQHGYHIIKLTERKSGVEPFSEAKGRIEEWMKLQGSGEKTNKWIKELRAKATIVEG